MGPEEQGKTSGVCYCAERERLRDRFLETVHDLTELQYLQTNAILGNDADLTRFEPLIRHARRVKNEAKHALVLHMESHCYRKPFIQTGTTYLPGAGRREQPEEAERFALRA